MIITDRGIRYHITAKQLGIDPFHDNQIQAASYDFRLGNKFAAFNVKPEEYTDSQTYPGVLNLERADEQLVVWEWEHHEVLLGPGAFIQATTEEYFEFPDFIAGKVFARSSIGRLGIAVSNGDAGWIDPGFLGHITLEIKNNSSSHIILPAGMRIGQMAFILCEGSASKVYNGSYQWQQDLNVNKWKTSLVKTGKEALERNGNTAEVHLSY